MTDNRNNEIQCTSTGHDDPEILYFGKWISWNEADKEYHSSNVQYNACLFSFRGSIVRWIGPIARDQGIASVYIDGVFQQNVDGYSEQFQSRVVRYERNGLDPDRIHTLRIEINKERHAHASDCYQRIEFFQSVVPVDYPKDIAEMKNAEYVLIRNGAKPYLHANEWSPVSSVSSCPPNGVVLLPGLFREILDRNIQYIKTSFVQPHYCCTSETWNPDGGPGWSAWLPGSNEGRLLAGAANSLRWEERADLRSIVTTIVDDIEHRMRGDGFYGYYREEDSYALLSGLNSERKNYDRVFWTRGLLAAGHIGEKRAYALVRKMYDWYNKSPYPQDMLIGFNATNSLPGGPMVHLSPVGNDEDLTVSERYGDQEYWINELIRREPLCLCFYPGERPHCYDLLGLEAFLDEYLSTGAQKYKDAVLGGWDIYRDNYRHIGGATAICEADGPYPPKSYYISTGHNGETCGSVFWMNINSKLLQLLPYSEEYALEIEESIYNVIAAAQDALGNIRYHNRLQGAKETGHCENTCCEVAACGLIGRLPEFIYSLGGDGVFVNLFSSSSIRFTIENTNACLTMTTEFPFRPEVAINVEVTETARFSIRIRTPAWASEEMRIYLNGSEVGMGKSGSFFVIDRNWVNGDRISFTLPMELSIKKYTGLDQIEGNSDRFALMYGPVLMALRCEMDKSGRVPKIESTPEKLPSLLTPIEGCPLEFGIQTYPEYKYMPYFKIHSETFTCFPVVEC